MIIISPGCSDRLLSYAIIDRREKPWGVGFWEIIMYVRTVSNIDNAILSSMVYAIVNLGWYAQYIVYNKWQKAFELVDYMDKSLPQGRAVVEKIQTETDGFEEYRGTKLLKLKDYCKKNELKMPDVKVLFGYPDVCENYAFLCDIIENRTVPANKYPIMLRDLPDVKEWRYIQTEEDVLEFMNLFMGFHDSNLVKISYEESDEGGTKANAIFDNSGWFGIVELCFEGVQYLKIVPPKENYASVILSATLRVDEDGVFWADEYMEEPDMSYEGSIIRALSLKWKKLEE